MGSFGVGSLKLQIVIKNGKQPPKPPTCPALSDTLRVFTTVGFPVLQFNAVMKQFVATRKVPRADSHELRDRTLVVVVWEAKAAAQIVDSISFTWRASVQREPPFKGAVYCAIVWHGEASAE